ncbi:MAG: hypothetical protein LBR73_01225 [Oscillospiraceae bacterium]|jgi:hypothetical protein|nr:hypothetical protein [Oscillospiraceae bacterium]
MAALSLNFPRFPKTLSLHTGGFGKARDGLKGFTEIVRADWQKIALMALFGLGLFLGARTAASDLPDWGDKILEMLKTSRLTRADHTLLGNAFLYFGTDMAFMAPGFLCGLCAAGLPLVLFLPVVRGLGIGALTGWLVSAYGWEGLGYSLLLLFPATIVSMLVMFTYCKEAMLMSGDMLLVATKRADRVESSLRSYAARFIVLLLASAGAALLDAVCFAAFARFFAL